MTGQELYKYTQTLIDKDYSGYLDNTKANRLMRSALYSAIKSKYKDLSTQQIYDELSFLIKTGVGKTPSDNRVLLAPVSVSSVSIISSGGGVSVLEFTTSTPHYLTAGDNVYLSGVSGLSSSTLINRSAGHVTTSAGGYTFRIQISSTTTGTYTSNSGSAYGDGYIIDYMHSMTMEATFIVPMSASVVSLSNTSPIVLKLDEKTKLRTGCRIRISGAAGNTAANTDCYVKQLSGVSYELYEDQALSTPLAGDGAYTGGATVKWLYTRFCTPYLSDRKISSLGEPTYDNPKFEDTEKSIKIYPSNLVCSDLSIDYIATPSVDIDVADNYRNLSHVYNDDFLYYVALRFAQLFAESVKDQSLFQTSQVEIVSNP